MSRASKRAVFEDDRGDRISSLPSNVIDCILEFLPVQDAARTSILSKKWRYIWAMLPNLKLDNLFCNKLASRSQYVFEQTIDKILLQHSGDIVKFDLDLSGVELTPCPDINRWILYATRNGVKKLKLKMTKDDSPIPADEKSSYEKFIFSLSKIETLILSSFVLEVYAASDKDEMLLSAHAPSLVRMNIKLSKGAKEERHITKELMRFPRASPKAGVDADIKDRFSALPRNLVDDILRLLPVHDAARTSILSKNWRYIWAALPNLMLDKTFCSKLAVKSQSVLKETIDMILLQHIGDIVKFDLDVSGVQLCSYADIDRWMLYVTRYGVKKLILNMSKNISSTYKVPSYIFDCQTLTQLELFNCIFKPPNSFLGFQTLTILHLKEVAFPPAIEFYAIKTPLLVKLILTHCDGTQYLNIEFSSGLKYLSVRESHYNLDLNSNYFKNVKKLTYLYLVIDNPIPVDERLTLEKLIFSSPTLETLCLSQYELEDNAFGDPDEAVLKYLDAPSCLDRTLNKLEDVSIHVFKRSKNVLSFIKLLFAYAPSLSRMSIKPKNASSSKEELNVATELMRFPRVSPKAKLFYYPTVGLKAE
ncbi:hypothetical protein KY290_023182 [Solanum tuberosum]|uniref:F-box domain-containing protein n=1 Tax=Solanum tuberosum TaxID=4113 RepID=A0ABQ7V6K9_SOLTU|nr:hypothetical protein KY290_023182 [Solanum tuberosum]